MDGCEIYLQIENKTEHEKVCFKVNVDSPEKRREFRGRWHHSVMSKCKDRGLPARKPGLFGSGAYMTVAILDQEFRVVKTDGLIDMALTIKLLQSMQSVLDDLQQPA